MWGEEKDEADWMTFEEDNEQECIVKSSTELSDIEVATGISDDDERHVLPSAESGFYYLSCHRIGAQDIYIKNIRNSDSFGIDGEYALAYLLRNENVSLPDSIVKDKENYTSSLLGQVNYWLNYMVGTELSITDLKKTNYLQVKYNNNPANSSQESLYCRPTNVGSGISYLISIIILCLASEEYAVILIENPEIHLHPKAQSRLAEFLYFISRSGRQLFVETHSDHIFNGLRAGVATGEIPMQNLSVNFFSVNEKYETVNNPICFGEYGKITGLNDEADLNDLFDQFELDTDRMLGL
jgi:predicted ATPase